MIDALGERRLGLCKIDCCIGRVVEDDIRLMALQSTYQRTGSVMSHSALPRGVTCQWG